MTASVALLAGVVGPPWALLRFVGPPLPHGMPRFAEVFPALTQPPDPQLVLQGLAWVCWAAWVVFVLDVLAAAGQQLADYIGSRHDQNRAHGRGATWRPGALLIGIVIAAVLTLSRPTPVGGAHGGAVIGPAAVTPVVHILTTDTPTGYLAGHLAGGFAGSSADRSGERGGPSAGWVGVRAPQHGHHDSLWRIAERELGDGARWPELYARNAGVPQADGRALVRPELIQPGWQLALPTAPQHNSPSVVSPPRPHAPLLPAAPTPAAPDSPGAPAQASPAEPTTTPTSPVRPGGAATGANPAHDVPTSAAPLWVEIGAGLAVTTGLATAVAATLWRIHRARTEPAGTDRSGRTRWSSAAAYPIAHELARRSPWIPSSAQPLEAQRQDLRHTGTGIEDAAEDAGEDADGDGRDRGEHLDPGPAAPGVHPRPGRRGSRAPGAVLPALAANPQPTTSGAHTLSPAEPIRTGTDPWGMLLSLESTVAGVGLVGPGAVAALRGLLLDALYTDTGRQLIVVAGLPERLGIAPDQLDALGITVVPDLAGAALAALSPPAETVVVLAEAPDHPALCPTPKPTGGSSDDEAAQEVGALQVVVLGELHDGVTVYLRTDGTIAAVGPPAARTHLLGARLPVVDDIAGAELLDLATASRATPPPPDHQEEPADIRIETPSDNGAETRADVRSDASADVSGDSFEGQRTGSSPATDGTRPRRSHPVWTLQILGRPVLLLSRPSFADEPATADPSTVEVDDAVDVSDRVSGRMFDLLVYLALHPDGARRDAVVAALWPDTGRNRPSNNLSALINRLRNALQAAQDSSNHDTNDTAAESTATGEPVALDTTIGADRATPIVLVDGDRYRLDPDQIAVDYWTFLTDAAATTAAPVAPDSAGAGAPGPSGGPVGLTVVERWVRAHGLYRGLLAEGVEDAWIPSIREATRRTFLALTARLVRHHVATDPAAALQILETTRNLEPTNQSIYRDIMALQLQVGDNDGAAATLRLLKNQLADVEESIEDATRALVRAANE